MIDSVTTRKQRPKVTEGAFDGSRVAGRGPRVSLTTGGVGRNHVPNSLCNRSTRATSRMTTELRPLLLLLLVELVAGVMELVVEGLMVGVAVGRPVAAHMVLLMEVATRAEKGMLGAKMVSPPKAVAKEVLHIQEIIIKVTGEAASKSTSKAVKVGKQVVKVEVEGVSLVASACSRSSSEASVSHLVILLSLFLI